MPPATVDKAPCVPQDRRIARSKRALRGALVQLMEERGFDNLSVNDLCERADLTRATFYNHFHDKDELLLTLEDEVIADLEIFRVDLAHLSLLDLAVAVRTGQPLPLLVALFDYLREQGDFLHAVLGPGGDIRFGPRLRDCVCTDLVWSILHDRYRESTTSFVGYYVSFYAGAYLGVIMRWIETGMQESSEDMARIALRLFFIQPGESIVL
ncbi:TetR/AcrR family transcriptional regulator [Xiamenia xianingshaonis]